jgi:hypothetical protein
VFFFILFPLFMMVMCMTNAIQTPSHFPEKGIDWGKVEEVEA